MRLRPFLASFPVARSADGKHAVAGTNNFSLAEVVVMPESVDKAAQKVAAAHPSEGLLLLTPLRSVNIRTASASGGISESWDKIR